MDEKKTLELKDSERPKDKKEGWDTSSCPFFVFGDDAAAEHDVGIFKKLFNRFKKKKKN